MPELLGSVFAAMGVLQLSSINFVLPKELATLPYISRDSVSPSFNFGATIASEAVVYTIAVNAASRAKIPRNDATANLIDSQCHLSDGDTLLLLTQRSSG